MPNMFHKRASNEGGALVRWVRAKHLFGPIPRPWPLFNPSLLYLTPYPHETSTQLLQSLCLLQLGQGRGLYRGIHDLVEHWFGD